MGIVTPSESESTVDRIRENGCYRDNELSCKTCSARKTNKIEKMKVQKSKIGCAGNETREASSNSSTGELQTLYSVCSKVYGDPPPLAKSGHTKLAPTVSVSLSFKCGYC
jgi:hypothetical protein